MEDEASCLDLAGVAALTDCLLDHGTVPASEASLRAEGAVSCVNLAGVPFFDASLLEEDAVSCALYGSGSLTGSFRPEADVTG